MAWTCLKCERPVVGFKEDRCVCFGGPTTPPREKPMKQDATRKIAAQFLAGEATLEELDDAVVDERIRKRDAEIEKLRKEVGCLRREVLVVTSHSRSMPSGIRIYRRFNDHEDRLNSIEKRLNNRPWWKKLLGMK